MAYTPALNGPVLQDSLRDKLGEIFVSMEKNLNLQTQTLQGMYKLQQDSFVMEKNRIEDQQRAERFARDDDSVGVGAQYQTPEVQKPEVDTDGAGSSIGDLIRTVISGMGVAKIIAGVGIVLIGDAIKGYISTVITKAFGADTDGDGEGDVPVTGIRQSLLDAIFTASTAGAVGLLFGKRVAALFSATGFAYAIASDSVEALNNAIGTEFDTSFWGIIGTVIAGAIALRLPGIIQRAFANGMRSLRVPTPGAGTSTPRPGAAVTTPSGQTIQPRRFTQRGTYDDGAPRLYDSSNNEMGRNTQQYKASRAAYDRDQDLLRQMRGSNSSLAKRLLRINGLVGALISAPRLWEIANSDLPGEDKMALFAEELGALGGGVLGGVAGALGGTAIFPGIGSFIGGAIGGVAGSIYGAELANWIAGYLLGDDPQFDTAAADIGQMFDDSSTASGASMVMGARPTASGIEGDYARADWDARFSGYLDSETGQVLENAVIPERPDDSANNGLSAIAWDRQWRSMIDAQNAPIAPISPQSMIDPIVTDEGAVSSGAVEDILAAAAAPGPIDVNIAAQGDQVGQVAYSDNSSVNYFISSGNGFSPEDSLNPFFSR